MMKEKEYDKNQSLRKRKIKKLHPIQLLQILKTYEYEKTQQEVCPKVSKKYLIALLKTYFGKEYTDILNLEFYKRRLLQDCFNESNTKIDNLKDAVLSQYSIWPGDRIIDDYFFQAWNNLAKEVPSQFWIAKTKYINLIGLMQLEKKYLRILKNDPQSVQEKDFLENYQVCFETEQPIDTMVEANIFFELCDDYLLEKGLHPIQIREISVQEKISLVNQWVKQQEELKKKMLSKMNEFI